MSSHLDCAYCHEPGHHIRFCTLLTKKKERESGSVVARGTSIVGTSVARGTSIVAPLKVVPTNMFSVLFSDEEEGEVVEDREEPVEMRKSWSRSGLNGVQIKTVKPVVNKQADDFNPILLERSLKFINDYVAQFNGIAWADI